MSLVASQVAFSILLWLTSDDFTRQWEMYRMCIKNSLGRSWSDLYIIAMIYMASYPVPDYVLMYILYIKGLVIKYRGGGLGKYYRLFHKCIFCISLDFNIKISLKRLKFHYPKSQGFADVRSSHESGQAGHMKAPR